MPSLSHRPHANPHALNEVVAKEIPDYKFVFLLLLFRLKEGERKKKKLLSRDSTKTKDRQKYYEQVLLRLQEFFLSEDKQETQQ